jgi:hypothetical protein
MKVDNGIATDWLRWLHQEEIPRIVATGCFTHAVILQLLEVDNSDGPTYAVQYHAESKALYNRFIREHSVPLQKIAAETWGSQVVSFRSVLQVITE